MKKFSSISVVEISKNLVRIDFQEVGVSFIKEIVMKQGHQ